MITLAMFISITALLVIFSLVLYALCHEPPEVKGKEPPQIDEKPSDDWLKIQYQETTSLYNDVEREIWQISTIFATASLLLMGWVVTKFDKLSPELILVIGCGSIILVAIATLFKHRLREFNLVHIHFLRRIERAASKEPSAAEYWGIHHVRRAWLKSKGNFCRTVRSIHWLMDLYFFVFTALWAAIWVLSFNGQCGG